MPNLIESMVRAMGVEPTTHSKIDQNRHFRSKSVKIANFAQKSDQKSIKIVKKSDPGGQPDEHRKNIEKPTPCDSFLGPILRPFC